MKKLLVITALLLTLSFAVGSQHTSSKLIDLPEASTFREVVGQTVHDGVTYDVVRTVTVSVHYRQSSQHSK